MLVVVPGYLHLYVSTKCFFFGGCGRVIGMGGSWGKDHSIFSEHGSIAYQINRNETQNTLFAKHLL